MKNEILQTLLFCSLFFVCCGLLASLAGNFAEYHRIRELSTDVQRLESELGQYRTRADNLEESEREFASLIDEAKGYVEGAGRSIRSIGNSVQDLRSGLAELQTYVEKLEDCLCVDRSIGNSNDIHNSDSGEDE